MWTKLSAPRAGLNPSPVHANGGPGMWVHSSSLASVPASYAGEYRVSTSWPCGPSTPLSAKNASLVGTSIAATLTNLNPPRVASDSVTDDPGVSGVPESAMSSTPADWLSNAFRGPVSPASARISSGSLAGSPNWNSLTELLWLAATIGVKI